MWFVYCFPGFILKKKCNFWDHVLCSGFEISESWWILLSGKSWCNNGFFSTYYHESWWEVRTLCRKVLVLLMEEILHQLIGSLSHYLQGFIHPRWLFGISEPSTVGKHMPEDFCPKWFTPKYHWPWNSGLAFFCLKYVVVFKVSGQIIATSQDLGPQMVV